MMLKREWKLLSYAFNVYFSLRVISSYQSVEAAIGMRIYRHTEIKKPYVHFIIKNIFDIIWVQDTLSYPVLHSFSI